MVRVGGADRTAFAVASAPQTRRVVQGSHGQGSPLAWRHPAQACWRGISAPRPVREGWFDQIDRTDPSAITNDDMYV